jgi:DNA polymerase V
VFALIDCNNFYASVEELFEPKIKNHPVLVLSNNDGCVIARNKKAKEMNIKMGDPIFYYKKLIENKKIFVFSSNFTLYGDISNRIMQIIKSFNYEMEIYSIDEAFIYIDEKSDYEKLLKKIKSKIKKYVGIDVSIGLAKTKTLSKLASFYAKKEDGVLVLDDENKIDEYLKKTDTSDIWGIGKQLSNKLKNLYIFNAYDFKYYNENIIKKKLTINGLKTKLELNETVCYKLNESMNCRKSISSTRSFASKISTLNSLNEKISFFAASIAKKLRDKKLNTSFLSIFITTSFLNEDKKYFNSISTTLDIATSNTTILIKIAKNLLKEIYKEGYFYKKAGVIVSNLSCENENQDDFFSKKDDENFLKLLKKIDLINYKKNKKLIYFAAEGIEKNISKSNKKSKKYTTNFQEILKIKI